LAHGEARSSPESAACGSAWPGGKLDDGSDIGVERVRRLHDALTEFKEVAAVDDGLGSGRQPAAAGDWEAQRCGGARAAASSPPCGRRLAWAVLHMG
jgi:hypothetical protein